VNHESGRLIHIGRLGRYDLRLNRGSTSSFEDVAVVAIGRGNRFESGLPSEVDVLRYGRPTVLCIIATGILPKVNWGI
jgi:hypothetical protein